MKRLVIILSLLAITVVHTAFSRNYSFYITADSGISCAESTHVCAPNPPWDPAVQGYNAPLGNCPIISLGIGCELWNVVDLELNMSNRSIFHYRKCQTPTTGGDSYTRTFDLDSTSILFSTTILGRGIPYLHGDVGCGSIYPMIGVGLGSSNLLITNFRTIGLPSTGDSAPYPSFSAENQYTMRKNFTYTLSAGVEYRHHDCWAISTGYRWFNAGNFKGPRFQRVADGSAVDVGGHEWNMRFRAHEWFVKFKIFI